MGTSPRRPLLIYLTCYATFCQKNCGWRRHARLWAEAPETIAQVAAMATEIPELQSCRSSDGFVRVKLSRTDYSRLEEPYGKCDKKLEVPSYVEKNNMYTVFNENLVYTQFACIQTCMNFKLIELCGGCYMEMVDKLAESPAFWPLFTGSPRKCNYSIGNYVRYLSNSDNRDDCIRKCRKPCYETIYKKEISIRNKFKGTVQFEIQFVSFDITVISSHPRYTLVSLLSDTGGLLGLWMGLSIITLFELVELVWRCSCALWAILKRIDGEDDGKTNPEMSDIQTVSTL